MIIIELKIKSLNGINYTDFASFFLQDQYDNLSVHTHKGIEFLDKCGQFVKERCAIETEYATKLRRLVKNHSLSKKKEEEDNQ